MFYFYFFTIVFQCLKMFESPCEHLKRVVLNYSSIQNIVDKFHIEMVSCLLFLAFKMMFEPQSYLAKFSLK